MMKKEIKAIVFDIDGTLIETSIWNFLTEYMGASLRDHLNILKKQRNGVIKRSKSLKEIKKVWVSSGKAGRETFEEAYKEIPFRDGVTEAINFLKDKFKLCVITGSMDVYAKTISERLGIDHHYGGTVLRWDEGVLSEIIQEERGEGEVKLDHLKDFCNKNNILPDECVTVGDGENDIEVFNYTQKGIFIKSSLEVEDGSLEKYSWKSIKHFSELQEVI